MLKKSIRFLRIVLLLVSIQIFLACNRDIENVKVQGYVIDAANEQPIANSLISLENAYYEGGDYVSYNHYENYTAISDSDGYFFFELPKSAFVILVASKKGFSSKTISFEVYGSLCNKNIYIESL